MNSLLFSSIQSAYAKASADKYDPPSLLRASACALCASAIAKAFADKMVGKSEDKYEIGGEGVARICREFPIDGERGFMVLYACSPELNSVATEVRTGAMKVVG